MLNCESCAQYRPIYRYSYFQLRIVCFQLQHILNTVFRYGYWNTFNRAGKFCSKQNWKKYVRKLGGFNLKNTRQCKRSQVKRKLISYKNIFENLWEWKKNAMFGIINLSRRVERAHCQYISTKLWSTCLCGIISQAFGWIACTRMWHALCQ